MINRFIKDPDALLDYTIDWSDWLGSDTILTSEWFVSEGITDDHETNTSTSATVWLSGGTAGVAYLLTNRVTTALGRIDDRVITIWVGAYTDFECLIIGTALDVNNQPVSGVKVFITKVEKSGSVIEHRQNRVPIVSDANGIIAFSLPRDCSAWIQGSFFSGATNFGLPKPGVRVAIPDDDTANLEDLGSAASGPTTGLTIKVDDVPLNGLYNILNFVSPGIIATPGVTGTLNVSVLPADGFTFHDLETPTPDPDGVTTVFTLSEAPIPGSEYVYLNPVLQEEGVDYTISGAAITFAVAPDTGFTIRVSYRT